MTAVFNTDMVFIDHLEKVMTVTGIYYLYLMEKLKKTGDI